MPDYEHGLHWLGRACHILVRFPGYDRGTKVTVTDVYYSPSTSDILHLVARYRYRGIWSLFPFLPSELEVLPDESTH